MAVLAAILRAQGVDFRVVDQTAERLSTEALIARLNADGYWPTLLIFCSATPTPRLRPCETTYAPFSRAMAAVQTTARYLGLGLGSIVNALDPDRVYIGGELTLAALIKEGITRIVNGLPE